MVLVSGGEIFSATRFRLQLSIGGKWVPAEIKLIDTYAFKSRHHEAVAHTFLLDAAYDQVDAVKLLIGPGAQDVIVLRELNFIYDMETELEQLYGKIRVSECTR
jgi:hypothetical protein